MAKRAPEEEEVGESDDGMGWPAKKGAPAEKPKKADTGKAKRPSAEGDAAKAKPKGKGDTGKNPAVKSSAVKEAKEPKENLKASGKRKTSGVRKAADGEGGDGEENLSASARRRREKPVAKTNWALWIGVLVFMAAFTVFAIMMQKGAHGPPEKKSDAPAPAAAPPPATEAPKKE